MKVKLEKTETKTAGFGMNIWLKISEGIDEIEPLGILDDVSTIVNIKCGYKRDEFCESPVYQTLFSSSNFLFIQSIGAPKLVHFWLLRNKVIRHTIPIVHT